MENLIQKVIPIENLELSVRSCNCLKHNGVHNTAELIELTQEDLNNMRNMGKMSVDEVLDAISRLSVDESDNAEILKYNLDDYKRVTVLHYVAEETLVKEVSSILFQDRDGLYVEDISAEELSFSKRTMGVLFRTGHMSLSKIINMKYSDLCELSGMGAKCLDEIIEKLSEVTVVRYSVGGDDESLNDILEQLSYDLDNYVENKVKLQILGAFKTTLIKNNLNEYINTTMEVIDNTSLLHLLYSEDVTKKLIHTVILSLLKNRSVTYSFIKSNVPQSLITSGRFDELLKEMQLLKKIEENEDGYCIYYPNVVECLEKIDNEKMEQALRFRLMGMTLEETGNELGVTRERARQLSAKALKQFPRVKEVQYKYWFENYALSKEDFMTIFKVSEESFNYMNIMYDSKGTKSVENIFEDTNCSESIARRAEHIMKKYCVVINGEYVSLKRDIITKKLLKLHHSEIECAISDFSKFYNAFLVENRIDDNEKLLYTSEHGLEARLADCDFALMKYGRRVRYYNIKEYDVNRLFKELGLENYFGYEISTLKLFLSNAELMEEFNIQDEYELHNLMKKCESQLQDIGISLGRMPLITIGVADRAKQVEEFLFRLAPIEIYQFSAAYEEEYGVKSETVLANFVQYINKYYHNSMFTVDQEEMNSMEYAELQRLLVDDFYFINDIEKIYKEAFPVGDSAKVNAYNLKVLGFLVYVDYAVRSKYETADKYFCSLLLSSDVIDINSMNRRMCYNKSFYKALDNLRFEYDLLEVEPGKYISFRKFAGTAPGVTKEDLKEYSELVPQSTTDKYFTIKSVRARGISTKIDDLGYSDWFYSALLRSNKTIRYSKMAGGFLFSHENKQITRGDFFAYVVEPFGQIAIIDFMRLIENKYGLKVDRYDIPTVINSTSMYYSQITEMIYASKVMYYSKGTVHSSQTNAAKTVYSSVDGEQDNSSEVANTSVEYMNDIEKKKENRTHINPNERKIVQEAEPIEDIDITQFAAVLRKFNRGFRMGSSLESKKFIRFYEEEYNEVPELSEFQIETMLSRVGVVYENRIYATTNIINENVAENVNEYIQGMFNEGRNIVYYASIYQEFKEEFQHQQVYSVDMLKCYLEHLYNGKYYMKRFFIANNPNSEANPADELRECLMRNHRSMTFEEMGQELPHIPMERIKSILATNAGFIRDARGCYFAAEIIHFDDDELRQIELLIRDAIEINGFMAGNKLLEILDGKYPDIFDKLSQFQGIGKRDCIAYWLRDRFSFNGNVISEYGKSYKMQDIFTLYCQKHTYITMDMLNALKIELDTTIYFDTVYDNTLRISEGEFVSKDQASFNVAATDNIIGRFCEGDYIALSKIEQFALFPDAGFSWNTYLLEHYIYAYSEEYMLLHTATFNAKPVGIIVRRSSQLKTFEDVVADALVNSNEDLNEESALIYLSEQGYIARRKVSSIDQIIIKAKRIREKKR